MVGMIPVEDPVYEVTYTNKNITHDISSMLTSLVYTDYEHAQSDALDLELEDSKHLWKDEWFPELEASLHARIGYADGRWLDCGDFELDEIEFRCDHAGGDKVHIKALSTVITPALRTAQTFGYEGMTLRDIVYAVAERNKLKVRERDTIERILIDYTAQNHLTDLAWLAQLADDFGYVTGVRGPYLDFWRVAYLDSQQETLLLKRNAVKAFTLRPKSEAIAPEGVVSYHNPDQKKLVQGEAEEPGMPTGDAHKYLKRAPSKAFADTLAARNLRRLDKWQLEGTITTVGNTFLIAGDNLRFRGNRKLDGKYHITEAAHRMNRQIGYESEVQIYRVEPDYEKGGWVIPTVGASNASDDLNRQMRDYDDYANTPVPGL